MSKQEKQQAGKGGNVDETPDREQAVENDEQASLYEDLDEQELRTIIAERDAELKELQEQLEKAKDNRLRKSAEFDNYRKRVQRERSQIHDSAKASALKDFLSINDDLTRTLEASRELDVNQTFLEGVELVANKFQEVLKQNGVQRIDEKGVEFDVDLHDAMMRKKPDDQSVPSDTVLEIIENGYKIGDRTIRHAKVIVSE